MNEKKTTGNRPSEIDNDLMSAIRLICANMNIGLLIHKVEDPQDARSIRFVYSNDIASTYTGTDLSKLFGRPLLQAFPELAKTDLPESFAEVTRTQQAINLGAVEYGDDNIKKSYYAVKAFPLPENHLGVAFENITAKKQLERLVQDRTNRLNEREQELNETLKSLQENLLPKLHQLETIIEQLRNRTPEQSPERKSDTLARLSDLAKEVVNSARTLINDRKSS